MWIVEAGGGQDHLEVHRVQCLLLLRQGVSGGALEENPQTASQEVGVAEANTLQPNLFAKVGPQPVENLPQCASSQSRVFPIAAEDLSARWLSEKLRFKL